MNSTTPEQALPLGVSDFAGLRQDGMIYVDKTEMIARMAATRKGKFFLARPRRFGKSLLVSTFESLFKYGLRDFHGLAIEKLWQEQTYDTIRLDFSTIFVKRVVGVPGDYLQISGGHLYVNGELVEDPENMGSVPADYPLIHLGEDEYFVVGDNRRNSHDSRANDVGPISRKDIVGKVTRVILPFGNARVVK